METRVLTEPFEKVAVDIVGPFERSKSGHKYLLTAICVATRYPEAVLLKTIEAQEVAEGLLEIFSRTGVLRVLLTDQGMQFVGLLVDTLSRKLGIDKLKTSPYHPQSNRMQRTLGSMLRKSVERKIDWAMQVKFALFALRSTPCRMTGYSPFELVYGRELLTPLSLVADELRQPKRHSHKVEEWLVELR